MGYLLIIKIINLSSVKFINKFFVISNCKNWCAARHSHYFPLYITQLVDDSLKLFFLYCAAAFFVRYFNASVSLRLRAFHSRVHFHFEYIEVPMYRGRASSHVFSKFQRGKREKCEWLFFLSNRWKCVNETKLTLNRKFYG